MRSALTDAPVASFTTLPLRATQHTTGLMVKVALLLPSRDLLSSQRQLRWTLTKFLQQGNNAVGVGLGSGWYRGYLTWDGNKNMFGRELSLLLQLNITYADGTTETIVTDESWKSSTGAIRSSEIYHGEIIDATMEKERWTTSVYDDAKWNGITITSFDNSNLVATLNAPVTKHETFKPAKIFKTPSGEHVIDFGQNLVGFVQIKVKVKAGDKIVIQHAEVLDKSGNFYTDNLRTAKQQNIYVLKGGKEELFEPHFTFQGFRYVKIEGFPEDIKTENFTAVALYSDMKPTGSFTTSNPMLNQLQHNILWSQKGNFVDIPRSPEICRPVPHSGKKKNIHDQRK